eukprot:TRINITY_DN4440_c0_g2_i9.p2 TRINITY_DN4440_c0_g2~~TRINITY_DN4440_c0_g2_i9.p2  ORF type:complete len:165 (-),score=20.02 TRINITY_DN4440_c0_g2_i9:199-693(-)
MTSTLKRGIQTASYMRLGTEPLCLKFLDELNAGLMDGLTHEEFRIKYPEEYTERMRDKLRYRYPRGESYQDMIERMEPIIFEIERSKEPVLVIGHLTTLRCIYAYFTRHEVPEIPHLHLPINTCWELAPDVYFCQEKIHIFNSDGTITEEDVHHPAIVDDVSRQ